MRDRLPILVSVPHGGVEIPREARQHCVLGLKDVLADGDTWSRQLYDFADEVVEYQAATVARAIVDLNRAPDDLAPANPDGALKSRTLDGAPVWRGGGAPFPDVARRLLALYHGPYHRELEVRAARPRLRLAVDCHTMLLEAPPGGPGGGKPRPLICLSNRGGPGGEDIGEGTSAPPEVLRALGAAFEEAFSDLWDPTGGRPFVTLNDPFRGGYITRHHGLGTQLPWIQVELNRCLYLDATSPPHEAPPAETQARLSELRIRILGALGAALGRTGRSSS
jgi:N-formylglutamate deformylase